MLFFELFGNSFMSKLGFPAIYRLYRYTSIPMNKVGIHSTYTLQKKKKSWIPYTKKFISFLSGILPVLTVYNCVDIENPTSYLFVWHSLSTYRVSNSSKQIYYPPTHTCQFSMDSDPIFLRLIYWSLPDMLTSQI